MCVFCVHRWVDQSPVTYTHWASGEPNNANGEEQCVQFNRHQGTAGFSLVKILLCLNTRFTERLLAIIYVLLRWMERRQLWPNCRLPLQEVPRRHSHHSCTHTALAGILSCRWPAGNNCGQQRTKIKFIHSNLFYILNIDNQPTTIHRNSYTCEPRVFCHYLRRLSTWAFSSSITSSYDRSERSTCEDELINYFRHVLRSQGIVLF